MTTTPASLLDRLRQPFDPEAWARLVALYTPLIYSWGRRVGLQDQDAADLVQDVFVTLLQVLPTFNYERHGSFRRWLRTITLNKWRNIRKQWNQRVLRGQESARELQDEANGLQALWETEYQQHLASQALRIMRADFQEKTWKACWEMVAVGRPAAEIAAELGLTVGAVYAAKFRILDRLRRELHGMLDLVRTASFWPSAGRKRRTKLRSAFTGPPTASWRRPCRDIRPETFGPRWPWPSAATADIWPRLWWITRSLSGTWFRKAGRRM
jgi:RNA polymerase sigma-70 factor (ECF subfamily)